MMMIDEAIIHAENVALNRENGLYDAIALGGQNPSQEEIDECIKCAKEHRQLAEWLKELKRYQWIPVSERLPSAEDCPMDCMVTRRSKYVGNYTDMAVAEADGTWTHEDWKAITIKGKATCISTRDADIIAWMPLPEPYREDGEEE